MHKQSELLLLLDTSIDQSFGYNKLVDSTLRYLAALTPFYVMIPGFRLQPFLLVDKVNTPDSSQPIIDSIQLILKDEIDRGGDQFDLLTTQIRLEEVKIRINSSPRFIALLTCGRVPPAIPEININLYIPFGPKPKSTPENYIIPSMGQSALLASQIFQAFQTHMILDQVDQTRGALEEILTDLGAS